MMQRSRRRKLARLAASGKVEHKAIADRREEHPLVAHERRHVEARRERLEYAGKMKAAAESLKDKGVVETPKPTEVEYVDA